MLIILFVCSSHFGENKIKNNISSAPTVLQNEKPIYITGIIMDRDNEPFHGVNIIIKNTQIGAVADENGKYRIDITDFYKKKEKIMVVYSFVGYKNIEKKIHLSKKKNFDDIIINITLKEEAEAILCYG